MSRRAALRFFRRVYLALDADDPGRRASARLRSELGARAVVVELPQGAHDVSELGADACRKFGGSLRGAAHQPAGPTVTPGLLMRCSLFEKMEAMDEGMRIEWGTRAIRDMRRLAARDRERVIDKIEQYAEDPASLARQVIALTDSPYRRLRVGQHRVIFTTQHGEPSTLVVLRVRHRREAYD